MGDSGTESHQGGAPGAEVRGREGVAGHVRVSRQRGVDGATEIANALSMDDADVENAALTAFGQIVVDERFDVPWTERMEVENAIDGQWHRCVAVFGIGRRVGDHAGCAEGVPQCRQPPGVSAISLEGNFIQPGGALR